MEKLDLLVFGTGPASTRIVPKCRDADWKVGVVDPRPFGGTCALRGCNPKKVLVRFGELIDWIERVEGKGVRAQDARIEWPELMAFKKKFTDPISSYKEHMFDKMEIRQFHGSPKFVAPDRVAVDGQEIASEKFVIATGAVPAKIGFPGEEFLETSDDFLEYEQLPQRLLLVGGGYISLEFAHVAVRAGAEVTIVEMADRPLLAFEEELVEPLMERSRELGIDIRTKTKVSKLEKQDDGSLVAELESEEGQKETLPCDRAIHGAGRVPNVESLELDAAEVKYSDAGIQVNRYLQSVSNERVYAAGDVVDSPAPPLSPVASHDGRIVAKNLMEGNQFEPEYGPVPTAVYTVPGLAKVGLNEAEAREQSLDFEVLQGDRSRDHSMKKVGARHARYKILVDNRSDEILGAHLLGPDAAETINLFTLAMAHRITATQMKGTLLVFPTFGHDVRPML
jgi:glutathione reductase (NADPH)